MPACSQDPPIRPQKGAITAHVPHAGLQGTPPQYLVLQVLSQIGGCQGLGADWRVLTGLSGYAITPPFSTKRVVQAAGKRDLPVQFGRYPTLRNTEAAPSLGYR
jgi:hypothetical protein